MPFLAAERYEKIFKDNNYELVGKYKGVHQKVNLICPEGHSWIIAANSFKKGARCSFCRKDKIVNDRKIEFINLVNESNYIMIGEFVHPETKVELQCPKFHIRGITSYKFLSGRRCGECALNSKDSSKKKFLELIKSEGYELHDTYVNASTHHTVMCSQGHIYKTTATNFNRGYRCKICAKCDKNTSAKEFFKLLEEIHYIPIGKYINSQDKIEVRCDKGHLWRTSSTNLKRGRRCKRCASLDWEYNKEKFLDVLNNLNYQLLDDYYGYSNVNKIKCCWGHLIEMTPYYIVKGYTCRICKKENSCHKIKFTELCKTYNFTILSNYENTTLPIDIICPKGHKTSVKAFLFNKNAKCNLCLKDNNIAVNTHIALELFLNALKEKGYSMLEDYKGSNTPIMLKCPNNHICIVPPYRLRKNYTCLTCSGRSLELIKSNFLDLVEQEGYTILSEYISTMDKIDLMCPNFHVYSVTPGNFKSNKRCSKCPRFLTKGEQKVIDSILELGYDPLGKIKLPNIPNRTYDDNFYIEDICYIVEFDGKQHFEYTEHFHDDELEFVTKQEVDCIKSLVVLSLPKYKLIRISYKHMKNVTEHILNAINSENNYYFSDDDLYDFIINVLDDPEYLAINGPKHGYILE